MGLLEELGAWLDQKKRNVAANVRQPGLLWTQLNEDARQYQQGWKEDADNAKSVMPEVRQQANASSNAKAMELGGLLGGIARAAPKEIAAAKRFKGGEKAGIYRGSEAFGGITPAKLGSMRSNYIESAITGAPYSKYWYDDTSKDLWRIAGHDVAKADPLAEVMATTSSSTPVGSNAMYGFKGWNQYLVNDPINTGKYPTRMSQDIQGILSGGQQASGLKRSPYAGGLSVEWRPDPDLLAVNDIHNVRAWGITDPKTGKQWSKGVGEAGHRFLQDQHKVVADRLNDYAAANIAVARAAGASEADIAKMIQPDWNNYRVQAAAWSTQRNRGPQKVPMTEAGKHYGDFLNDYAAQVTREWTPGSNTGHAQGLLSMPYAERQEFADAMEANVRGPEGIDAIASRLGALSDTTLPNAGVYEGVAEPGFASRVMVGKGLGKQTADDSSAKLLDAIAATHGLLGVQKQSAWNYLGGKAPINTAGGYRINRGTPFSPDELSTLRGLIPNADVPQVDPRGARVLEFADPGAASRAGTVKDLRAAASQFDATVEPSVRSGNLFPVDENFNAPATWSAKPYIEKIEAAGPRVVDNWNAEMPTVAAGLLRTAEDFFAKHNLTAAPWYRPMMEGIQNGGLQELKRLVKAGIVPAVALAAFGLRPEEGGLLAYQ